MAEDPRKIPVSASRSRLLTAVLLIAAAWPAAGIAFDEETRFARISTNESGVPAALQMSVVTYEPADGAYKVDLISAIHIGDRAYYRTLNERFKDYEKLLYELVAPEGRVVPDAEAARGGFVSGTQIAMTQALGLSFQLEHIDYSPDNFVHADLSPQRLAESMDERGESLYVYFWRLFFAAVDEMGRDPLGIKGMQMYSAMLSNDDRAFKIAVARELVDIDRHRDLLSGENGSAIIDSRNDRALEVLREELAAGVATIGIFYGVAHMPDFDRRLREDFGLQRRRTAWVNAWSFDEPDAAAR